MFDSLRNADSEEKTLKKFIKHTVGYQPKNISLYQKAFRHKSVSSNSTENNERLEFLGDSVLGAIVAAYLFQKYPRKDEGFLTEMRSRIVQRKHMNQLADELHLNQFIRFDSNSIRLDFSDLPGDCLEAFIGAVYLDMGFDKTKQFIEQHLLLSLMNMDELEENDENYKGKLYTITQRKGLKLEFVVLEEMRRNANSQFKIGVKISGQIVSEGSGFNKKEAEQQASKNAIAHFNT